MAFDTQVGSVMNVSKVLAKQNEYIKEHAVRGAGIKSTSVTLNRESSEGNYYNFNVTLEDGKTEVSGEIFCPKGQIGQTGATGETGETGRTGEQGVSIVDVVLQIVSSLPTQTKYRLKCILSNGNEIFTGEFTVYKGEKGATGERGERGERGENGTDGISVTDIHVVSVGSQIGSSMYRFEGSFSDGRELNIGDIVIPDGKTPFYTTITPRKNSDTVIIPDSSIPLYYGTEGTFDYITVGTLFVTANNMLGYVTSVNSTDLEYVGKIYYVTQNVYFSSESPELTGLSTSVRFKPSKLLKSEVIPTSPSVFDYIIFFNGVIGQINLINTDTDLGNLTLMAKEQSLGMYIYNGDLDPQGVGSQINFPIRNLKNSKGITIGSTVAFKNGKIGYVRSGNINDLSITCDIVFDYNFGGERKVNFSFPNSNNKDYHLSMYNSSSELNITKQDFYARITSKKPQDVTGITVYSTILRYASPYEEYPIVVNKPNTKLRGIATINICPTDNTALSSLRYWDGYGAVKFYRKDGGYSTATVIQSQGYSTEFEIELQNAGEYYCEVAQNIGYGAKDDTSIYSFDLIPLLTVYEVD